MALAGRRVTVTDVATRLDVADADGILGRSITVTNAGAAAIDLGGSAVTAGAGYALAAGATVTLANIQPGDVLYGRAAAATSQPVHVLESGV